MKRQEQNENSREKILAAAIEEFGEKGYIAASTNNICKNNGISKGLLFHYYKSKDDLFLICVKKCFKVFASYLEQHLGGEIVDTKENLNKYFETRLSFFKEYPFYEEIFYTAVINTPEHLKKDIELAKEVLNQVNMNYISQTIEQLDLKPDIDKQRIIQVIYGLTNYLHMKYKSDYYTDVEERHNIVMNHSTEIKDIIIMLFYGILK